MTVRLFLDHRVNSRIGETGHFSWWLIHTGIEVIGAATVELHPEGLFDHIQLTPCIRSHLHLMPDMQLKCPTSFIINQPGALSLQVKVTLQTVTGRCVELTSKQPVSFNFANDPEATRIEIEGDALIKNIPPGTFVRIQNNALVNWANPDAPVGAAKVNHEDELPKEYVYEIKLLKPSPDGLIPLDFVAFASAWQRHQRRPVSLSFVDQSGRRRDGIVKVGDVYCLQVTPHETGYLTLIARGTSGRYMILSPNTSVQPRVDRVVGQTSYFFPGQLFPEQLDFFGPRGVESAMALVTAQPLLPEASELLNEAEGTLNPALVQVVFDLLKRCHQQWGAAALGFVEITVRD